MAKLIVKSKEKLPKSQMKIIAEISVADLESKKSEALKKLNEEIEISGFRKGKIPEDILRSRVGDMAILEESLEIFLKDAYSQMLEEEKINAISRPKISILKLAPGNPAELSITVSLFPEVALPDFKQIAIKINSRSQEEIKVSDDEIKKVINEVKILRDSAGKKEETESLDEESDEFAKSLGASSIADLKSKIKENIIADKKRRAFERRRIEIIEEILKDSKIEMPDAILQSEMEKIENEFRGDLERVNFPLEKYLLQAKKKIEDIRKEWVPIAEKRAKVQLVLNKIAIEEKISVDKSALEEEIEHILSEHPKADPLLARIYVETMLSNEQTFNFLENCADSH